MLNELVIRNEVAGFNNSFYHIGSDRLVSLYVKVWLVLSFFVGHILLCVLAACIALFLLRIDVFYSF